MVREPMWRRYLRFWRANPRRDVDDELRFHLEERVEDLVAQGVPPDRARQATLDDFGDMNSVREELVAIDERLEQRHMRNLWLENARQDVRYALRGIRRNPLLASTIVLTLAIGVGAAGSMYGLMWRLLLQPAPHVQSPEGVVKIFQTYNRPGDTGRNVSSWTYTFFEHLPANARSFARVGAYSASDMSLGTGAGARRIRAIAASGSYWTVLGVRPHMGRFFTAAESHPVSGLPVAVLSHAFWREYFAGAEVLGRVVKIAGRQYEVIGVAPRGFRGVELEKVDVWLPLVARSQPGAADPWHLSPYANDLGLIGRLAPGITPNAASTELTTVMRPFLSQLNRQMRFNAYPDSGLIGTAASLTSELGRGAQGKPEAKVLGWLVGVGAILLAVAATNVAGLLLLRAMRRRREIALRSALGMSNLRLATLLLTETTVLALFGGVAGIVLLKTAGAWLERVVFPHLAWEPTQTLDVSTVVLIAGGVLATALLAGLVAMKHARRDVATALKEGAQHGSTRRSRSHRIILIAQTTLSVLLLIGATLFTRSLRNLLAEDVGVDARRVFSVAVDFGGTGRKRAEISTFYERARERIARIPGVEQTSLALDAPLLRSASSGGSIRLPGHDTLIKLPGQGTPTINYVTPEFFGTTGMQFIRGRTFDEAERDTVSAVIVSQAMANLYWPGRNPIGECVHVQRQTTCTTVVGVVRNQRMFRILEEQHLFYYRPLPRVNAQIGTVLLRTSMSPARTETIVRNALMEVQPDLPYVDISELATGFEAELRPWRLGVTIFTAFGILAMLLAAVGLTTAISYSVAERSREIGVRLAIGARRRDVLALILREGMAIGVAGIAGGVVIAMAAAPWLGDLLYKVSPRDMVTFGIVSGVVLLIVLAASASPARRAARIDPMRVLTVE